MKNNKLEYSRATNHGNTDEKRCRQEWKFGTMFISQTHSREFESKFRMCLWLVQAVL